jgi:hypothetical protein
VKSLITGRRFCGNGLFDIIEPGFTLREGILGAIPQQIDLMFMMIVNDLPVRE